MEPMRGRTLTPNLDATYNPPHRRALSEGDDYAGMNDDEKAFLGESEEFYYGRGLGRRGPRSPERLEGNEDPEAENYPLNHPKPEYESPGNEKSPQITKVLAWTRLALILLALLGSVMVLASNANMVATYRANPKARKQLFTSNGAVMGWWPAWPAVLDLTPTWALIVTGAVSTVIALAFSLASFTKKFRYLDNTVISVIVGGTGIALAGFWVAVSVVSYFKRQNMETDLAEWACWHTNDAQFAIPGISFPVMCAGSNVSKFGSIVVAALNLLIFATVFGGYLFSSRRSETAYGKLTAV